MAEDATSELGERSSGRDQVLHSTKTLLKSQLRRRALVRPQDYSRLWEGDGDGVDISDTLDRLPRFRFGGNRGNSKVRDRDKRNNEQRTREQKKQPVPPPRVNKHVPPLPHQGSPLATPETGENVSSSASASQRTLPLRSASFSQVDYSPDDNKYVRRRQPVPSDGDDNFARGALTLPRLKTFSLRGENNDTSKKEPEVDAVTEEPPSLSASGSTTDISSVNSLYDIIYRECKDDKVKQSIAQITNELSELQNVNEEPKVRNNNDASVGNVSSLVANQEKKRDKSRRRKGIYISQWPNTYQSNENIDIRQFQVDCSDSNPPSEQTADIPKLKISEPKPDNCEIWSSPQEEPMSPEENTVAPDWTNSRTNSTEEKEPARTNLSLLRSDSLSESEHGDQSERKLEQNLAQSDISDCESRISIGNDPFNTHVPRRYSKRPLRGPYGQMLEAEMKKPEADRKYHQYSNDLKFLEDLSTSSVLSTVSLSSSSSVGAGDPKPKYVVRSRGASNYSLDDSQLKHNNSLSLSPSKTGQSPVKRKVSVDCVGMAGDAQEQEQKHVISHQRTTSSPSKLEGFNSAEVSSELLEQLLRGSSEQLAAEANQQRTNVSYVGTVIC